MGRGRPRPSVLHSLLRFVHRLLSSQSTYPFRPCCMLFCQSNSLVYHMCIRIWLLRTFSSMCKQRHYWFCHYNSLGICRYGYLVALRIVFVVKRCHRRSGFCTDIIINLEWTHFRIKLQHRLVVILPNLSFLLALDCN